MEFQMRCAHLDSSATQDDPLPSTDHHAVAQLSGKRRISIPGNYIDHTVSANFSIGYNNDEPEMPLFEIGKSYTITVEEVTP